MEMILNMLSLATKNLCLQFLVRKFLKATFHFLRLEKILLKKCKNSCRKKIKFFKLFVWEIVLKLIWAHPRSQGCKKVSGIDSTLWKWSQRLSPAAPVDFRPDSGQKLHFCWCKTPLEERSPELPNTNPKLRNCRLHPNTSHVTVVCDYLTCKRVRDTFFAKMKNLGFQLNFL